jgi:hypothetical protein
MERPAIREAPDAREWFNRFRARYDTIASDPATRLGLFYERHRHFLVLVEPSRSDMVEYTNREWTKIMVGFLSQLAVEFGFNQTVTSDDQRHLAWFRPSVGGKRAVEIVQEDHATEAIVSSALPALVAAGSDLSVLMMYPDYPMPPGTEDLAGATEAWRVKVEATLARLRPPHPFLLLTIGANSWDIPARWHAFDWNPSDARLDPIESAGPGREEDASPPRSAGVRPSPRGNRRRASQSRGNSDRRADQVPREPAYEPYY